MGLRVEECGKSECSTVMVKIRLALLVATLAYVKTSRLPQGHNYDEDYRTFTNKKANDNEN